MKRVVPEYEFSAEQQNIISALATETGLSEQITCILYGRGFDTPEKLKKFMRPSKKNFLSPFLMSGMREAVAMLEQARDEGKTVAVFGDYDADGICALAIMYYALREFGIQPYIYVPERADGYGLSEEAIDRIFEECNPELFITVDCGISCAKEAQYIYELGSDVIVTDHHELPEVLPDCVIINPKLPDDYPYDNLCGAGVAFKLACALIGEKAYEYLDFATLATVADSVPLLGENRDIVTEGLRLFNRKLRPCFEGLLGKTYDGITAQSLAFNIAPRVNAAGRMGDAYSAFALFTAETETDVYNLSVKLCSYNSERQKCCDELYASVKQKLKQKGVYGNVIMLSDEGWNTGFVGIVAARIAEEFNRPTLLFVHNGDMLKGSARSIESINIFNALKNCSQYISEFGGHAQAAGVNVHVDNFDALERALNEEIGNTYDEEAFEQKVYVSGEIVSRFSERFAKELMALEPYGIGNRKPLFYITAGACEARPLKNASPHIAIKSEYMDLTYFSGVKHQKIITDDVRKQIVFDVSVSTFRGREYVKGIVRDLLYDGRTGRNTANGIFSGVVDGFYAPPVAVNAVELSLAESKAWIAEKRTQCKYGLCLLASDRRTLKAFEELSDMPCDLFEPSSKNVTNTIIVAPKEDVDLSMYRDILYLDKPVGYYLKTLQSRQVFVNADISGDKVFETLTASRETLLSVYSALRKDFDALYGETAEEVANACNALGFEKREFIFALKVFEELGLVAFENGKLTIYRGVKAELTDSALYRKVLNVTKA